MFIPSAANDTLQGRAIQAINERWNCNSRTDFKRGWSGTETIGIPVCKKKYAPFLFKKTVVDNDGRIKVEVVRMYGCAIHSHLRERVIKKVGERKGWEPFGQWSLKKAESLAKKVTEEINGDTDESGSEEASITSSSFSDDEKAEVASLKQLCHNGKCAWKMKHKFDDIYSEIHDREIHENDRMKSRQIRN